MKPFKIDLSSLKSFVIPVLILVTISLLVPFAFIPFLNNVKGTNESLKKQKERLGRLSEKLEILNSLDEREINENLTLAEQTLPVGKSLAPLIVGIQNLALGSNLLVDGISLSPGKVSTVSAQTQISPKSSEPNKNINPSETRRIKDSLVLNISLVGNIDGLREFLAKLEHARRISFPDDVSLTSSDERGFQIKVVLLMPFRPVPKSAGDALAEPLAVLSEKDKQTLEQISKLVDFTNIQIKEVKTNVVKDPFSQK